MHTSQRPNLNWILSKSLWERNYIISQKCSGETSWEPTDHSSQKKKYTNCRDSPLPHLPQGNPQVYSSSVAYHLCPHLQWITPPLIPLSYFPVQAGIPWEPSGHSWSKSADCRSSPPFLQVPRSEADCYWLALLHFQSAKQIRIEHNDSLLPADISAPPPSRPHF